MASTDGLLPSPEPERGAATRASALAVTALLNCLIREVARPDPASRRRDGAGGHPGRPGDYILPATGHVLRVGGDRYPAAPSLRTPDGWCPLELPELVALTAAELRAGTGARNDELLAEILHSRDVTAALLLARRAAVPPADLYLRSEQALVAGHRYHPAPKARGGGNPESWLPYAPEVGASFALPLLGVPVEDLVEEGDPGALDLLGDSAGDGLALLPAHPWQITLLGGPPGASPDGRPGDRPGHPLGDRPGDLVGGLRGGRLRQLGFTGATAVATASIRTVYLPEPDLFCKFSLDVRITNDVRRLWLHDLRRLTLVTALLDEVFDDLPGHLPRPAVLRDRGWRGARLGGDGGEALAVIVRDGLGGHLRPGLTALLAAGVSEGFPGNPLDALDEDGAFVWWERYLEHVVPPVLHAYLRHGLVLESHLQNVLVAVDELGLPAQVLFRDAEGVKLVAERYPRLSAPVLGGGRAWERLVYCLLTNNLCEIAGAVAERHPRLRGELWARARAVFAAAAKDHGDPAELRDLLAATHIPAKANLLLRWLDADGGAMRWVPIPNPLRLFTA
ncbi:IucA/IucC family C-terminal-domain containing protein [Nonomuraea fuscirosea]|uniref:IucA/IucC family C-terminal-domain containing protein n=1 Tax=Nonomuraea fuscirosea TaxID=1291556 RepID=UPI0037A98E1E